ncbi:hypothetical protein J6O86_07140 [bacterium]|nr:hypothetical protein [bacterium]
MNAIRQLNSGGLKLKSNFSAKSVAANVAANRGSAAAMVKSSNYTFGSNLLFTPANRIGGAPRYASSSALSRALNGQSMRFVGGGGIPAYSGVNYKQNFTMGTSNAFNAGMGVGSMINLGLSALKQLSDMGIIGGKKDVTPQGAGDKLLDKTNLSNTATTITSGNFTSSLSGAKSFAEVNKIENDIKQKKATLNTDYKEVGTKATANVDEILGGEGVSDGMKLAGVEINKSAFELSNLNPEDLEESIKTIDQDITKIGEFDKELDASKNKISVKSGEIKGSLQAANDRLGIAKNNLATLQSTNKDGCNDAKIAELEKQIEKLEKEEIPKLEEQKKQIEAADKAIGEMKTEVKNTVDSLNTKKTEIQDMKKAEDGMKDKKYDLAKTQDTELGQTMQRLEKLNQEIDQLLKSDKSPDKFDKKDEQRSKKLSGLIAQRSGLYTTLGQLVSSLSNAGDTTFINSKNQSYTIKNLENANNMLSNQPTETSGGGTIKPEANILTDSHSTNSAPVVKGQDEPINGGSIKEVNVTSKMKDLSKASDQYLKNILEGAISLGDSEQIEKIQAEISRRAGLDS